MTFRFDAFDGNFYAGPPKSQRRLWESTLLGRGTFGYIMLCGATFNARTRDNVLLFPETLGSSNVTRNLLYQISYSKLYLPL